MSTLNLERRALLKSASKATSLTIAFTLCPFLPSAAQAPATVPLPGSLNTNRMLSAWLRINANGTVTMFTGKVELGQGILTALTQIVADELDVTVGRLEVISGNTALTPNEGVTSGSLSVQDSGTALRFACAQARALLLQAAAVKLNVPLEQLAVSDGAISVAQSNLTTSYWEVAANASLNREAVAGAQLKPSQAHKLIGQSMARRDIPGKVTGAEVYVHDMRLPQMVFGRVVRPTAPRAQLLSVDEPAVQRMPGVVAIVRDGNFLAVAAEREEQAIAAASALQASAKWQEPGDLPPTGSSLFEHLKKQRTRDNIVSEKTDPTAAPATRMLEAEYTKPYQAHAAIGPSCAVAQWQEGKLSVWTHSQGVFPLRADLSKALRLPATNITVMHREGSGCYGHNGADDVALDAALLARSLGGRPVKLQWSRADEFAWEPLGSPMVIKLKAALDGAGKVVDWQHELWSHTHSTRPSDPEGCNLLAAWHIKDSLPPGPARNIPQPSGGSDRNALPLYVFPNQKVTNRLLLDSPIRTSALRTLGAYGNVFALESFIDELAQLAGVDPLAFRLQHLTDVRAKAVLEKAALMANWKPLTGAITSASTNRLRIGRGIGFAKYKNLAAYCAVIVQLVVDTSSGVISLEKVWSAVDAGLIINPDGLRNQIEGGIIQSASWSLYESVVYDSARIRTRSWAEYPIMKFAQVPSVDVQLINRPDLPPLGVGEGSQGPTVAAIANALADAMKGTGKRLRDLPFTADRVKQALI